MTHETRKENRMIGVFGQREPELVAIKILDEYWDRPYEAFTFEPADSWERDGLEALVAGGWLIDLTGGRYDATRRFWERVHGR